MPRVMPRDTLWESGFTLIEALVGVVIVGLLAAIAAPTWQSWLDRQRLNHATDTLSQAFRQAQARARTEYLEWRVGIRATDGGIEWATYPASGQPAVVWHHLGPEVTIDARSNLDRDGTLYQVGFNHKGQVSLSQKGRITLTLTRNPTLKRCVIVSTVLGHLRTGEETTQVASGCD